MTHPLSQTTQEVLESWCRAHGWENEDIPPAVFYSLASVLRTLADAVTPPTQVMPHRRTPREAMAWGMANQTQITRSQLLSIADELEGRADG